MFRDGLCLTPAVDAPSMAFVCPDAARALGVVQVKAESPGSESSVRVGEDGGRGEDPAERDSFPGDRELSCFAVRPTYREALEPDVIWVSKSGRRVAEDFWDCLSLPADGVRQGVIRLCIAMGFFLSA